MSSKLIVKPGPKPVVEPVAYMGEGGTVYIPKNIEKGGGCFTLDGTFNRGSYDSISNSTWSRYTPLYSGTVLEITETVTKEITL